MELTLSSSGLFMVRPGFTLAEMLVVLALIAGLFVAGVSSFTLLGANNLRGATSRLVSSMEHIYGRSAINGMRYQLIIDLDSNRYWAECTEDRAVLSAEQTRGTDGTEAQQNRYDDEEEDPFGMNLSALWDDCTEDLIPKQHVREGVRIERVLTTHQDDPYETGQASIAFFPNGFVEQSIIWLRSIDQPDAGMTLFVEPMTGAIRVERGLAEIPDDFYDVEEDR